MMKIMVLLRLFKSKNGSNDMHRIVNMVILNIYKKMK